MTELIYDDGSRYVGDVVDGKRHGTGYLTFSDATLNIMKDWDTKDDADFSEGLEDPFGISTPSNTGDTDNINSTLLEEYNKQSTKWAENYAYIGQWEDDVFHGIGTRVYNQRKAPGKAITKYIGEWKNGYKHGFGRMFWLTTTGKRWAWGVFQNNKGSGPGYDRTTLFRLSTTWKNGMWSDTEDTLLHWIKKTSWGATASWQGKLNFQGFTNKDDAPTEYEGTLTVLGIFPDPMTINFSDGSKFIGTYNFDTNKGNGTLTLANGYTYTGDVTGSSDDTIIFDEFEIPALTGYKFN